MIGILYENKRHTFENIHANLPAVISKKCKKYNLEKFVHVSALGIDKALDSKYAISKKKGEKNIIQNFKNTVILRPSVIFSVDDNFTTKLMTMLNLLPIFPLYFGGRTKFTPIHVTNFCEIIFQVLNKNISEKIIQCIGPEELTFKEILEKLLVSIDKKRLLIPMPIQFAKLLAFFFEKLPKPLLTRDQLNLLKYDNVLSNEFKSNIDLGLEANLKFENEISKYSYMWKKGGEYSKKFE